MPNPVSLSFRIAANLDDLRRNLAEGQTQLETTRSAMSRVANGFDGSRLLADANAMTKVVHDLGGASTLTAAEQARVNATLTAALEKYTLLGREAPADLRKLAEETRQVETAGRSWTSVLSSASGLLAGLGISVSIGALVQMTRAVLDDADALTKMHDKTGISVEGLQAMRVAGDDAGVSLDTMTAAVNMLQKRLGGDDTSAIAALRDLGISVEAFKAMDGAAQMEAISVAVRDMHDPLRVANDLSGLFGKSWSEQLPVLKRGFAELSDGTTQMSTATVKALDDAGDAVGRFWRAVKANLGEAVADIMTGTTADFRQMQSALAAATAQAEKAAPTFAAIVPGGLPDDLDVINAKFDEDAIKIRAAAKAADEHAAALKRAEEEMRRMTKAQQEHIASIGDKLFGAEDIKRATDYADAIGRVENVARMSADAQQEVARVMRAGIEALVSAGLSTDELTSRFDALRLAATATSREQTAAWEAMQRGAAAAATVVKTSGDAMEATFEAVAVTSTAAADNVTRTWQDAMRLVAAGQGVLTGTVQEGGPFTATREQVQRSFETGRYYGPMKDGQPDYAQLKLLPGRASGGPVAAHTAYMVGERGPELFVPETAGAIVPNGAGGSVTVHVHVGTFVGSDQSAMRLLAGIVKKELLGTLGAQRKLSAA